MKYFFAPMEGITWYPFRRVHHSMFPGIDAYYMPFTVANQTMCFKKKELRDIDPENNRNVPAVPQVLTNKADQFLNAVRLMQSYGYREINFNLGCPMATEVSKKKGAGFLSVPDELDRFFEKVFEGLEGLEKESGSSVNISVKTRIGVEEASESVRLTEIFNRYPFSSLIIHARRRIDFYKGEPDLETFGSMLERSRIPVCYNGDIFSAADADRFSRRFPEVDRIMIGRGLLGNPALVREITGGDPLSDEELYVYLNALYLAYREVITQDINVMFKMKEVWYYLQDRFPVGKKQLKQIRKARSAADYENAVNALFGK